MVKRCVWIWAMLPSIRTLFSDEECMAEQLEPLPEIDYLSKDYASFRHLMLDHLSLRVPSWNEPSAADLGNVIVEILAYSADYLSYYQDAVATEAYLGPARRGTSI